MSVELFNFFVGMKLRQGTFFLRNLLILHERELVYQHPS